MENKNHDTIPTQAIEETVSLCSGGGCCPEVHFCPDGTVCVSDDGKAIKMTYKQASRLCSSLLERGYSG